MEAQTVADELRPRRRDSKANLERIWGAATRVFATEGLEATLADVAKDAGVGVATVYRRFANKDDLILELFSARFTELIELAREASVAADPWDAFVDYFEETNRRLAADKGLRQLTLGGLTRSIGWARGTTPDRLEGLLADAAAQMAVHHTRLVRRAQEVGALRADIEPTDMMLLTMAIQGTLDLGNGSHPEQSQRILGVMLSGLSTSRERRELPVPALTDADVADLQLFRPPRSVATYERSPASAPGATTR
ncbi:MAG TPA: helix-turn-helix domain-containing protein [Galbitalea sp.]|jgi:AcrR family transcriptional regulator|nr:helix-turn-helix domain-containing protein [Galbitalea sp.]